MPTRRQCLIAATAIPLAAFTVPPALDANFVLIETILGAASRVGVFARDSATGRTLSHRADERFAMCSTFKLALAACVLAAADARTLRLDAAVVVGPYDILDSLRPTLPGPTTIARLCEAVVVYSDNTAANILLRRIGGPSALTRFMRAHHGGTTRLDRTEPTLNTNLPNDPRDTATPADMVPLMHALLIGDALLPASRTRLIGWMVACDTGRHRLRAGLPAGWRAGDKTGTGERGAANDLAIVWPAGRVEPILIASFVDAPAATPAAREAAHAAVGRMVAARFG